MWTFLPKLLPLACLASNAEIICKRAIETQSVLDKRLTIILELLDENYFRSGEVFHKGPARSCFSFRKFTSCLLGWTKH
jgi:hypothetical protein